MGEHKEENFLLKEVWAGVGRVMGVLGRWGDGGGVEVVMRGGTEGGWQRRLREGLKRGE